MLGFAARCAVYIAVMHWKLPTRYLLIGFFLEGISGGYFVNTLLAFVYTVDLTAKGRLRGTFLVIVGNLSYLFYGVVNFATGYFIRAFGFLWPTVSSLIFKIVLVLLLLVFAKETVKTRGKWSDLKLGKSMRRVLKFYLKTDKYQNKYSRVKFILCIICFITLSQSLYGLWSIETLYHFNSPFCFDSIKRGRYVGIISIVQPIVSTIALKIFQLF
ncbi:solute carrier family 46 member 3, partial [Octopus bimaculoides]